MKYLIVKADTSEGLVNKVQRLMDKRGWEPLGAHAVVVIQKHSRHVPRLEYSQVLINQSE